MRYVVFDFETASRADLQKVGAWKYAADMSTFPLCLSIKVVVDKRPQPARCLSEKQLHALDPELLELAQDPATIFVAHNASFEAAMWRFHMEPMGYPPLPPEKMHDTMAAAAMKALPLGLDACVIALELPVKKDMEGHRHMLMMCRPDKDGGWSHHTPENLARLYEYCNSDVDAQYGVYVSTQGLGPSERHTWVLDQKINQRGIKIDTEFVDACIDVLNQVRIPMTARFRELTGLNPTQREKVLNWVNDQGIPLGDMRKATLNAILDTDDEFDIGDFQEPLPYHVHEVLTLRRALASSSVAKLERMLQCAGSDGRVRYATQYHAARTGRDGGRLIQIQNYPRGEIGDRQGLTADILAEAILTRDLPTIREIWGDDIFSAIISSLRSCIVPEKGKVIASGDFAAVEARNLLSFAGQHDRVDQMHSGQDVYSETASMIYKRPINRKLPEHAIMGNIGKQTFLGCLSALTYVLTDKGWKTIIDVAAEDRLWDGEEWVTHDGLAYKGLKETLSISCLQLTTDHAVFDGVSWFRADETTKPRLSQALAFAAARGPYSVTPILQPDSFMGRFANVLVELGLFSLRPTISKVEDPQGAMGALRKKLMKLKSSFGVTPIFVPTKRTAPGCSTAFPQYSPGASLDQRPPQQSTMRAEGSPFLRVGNPWGLGGRKGLLNLSVVFSPTCSRLRDGIIPRWRSTVSTITATMRRGICALQPEHRTIKTGGTYPKFKGVLTPRSKNSKFCEPVYDLVNAGPRHRFTVMTCSGPLIVHNSGYGLGPVGFRARFAPKESIDFAKICIDTYRKEVAPMVPRFWYNLFAASMQAVWCDHAKTYDYAGIEFRKEGDFLTMRLPSGRKIWYHRPRKEKAYNPVTGDENPSWSFMSYQGKKFRRHLAWHGMVTADCVQGSARDLMTEAMKRAESAGLYTIFKVHDELVFEEYDRPDLCEQIKQIMEDISPWARERKFRVKAEVEKMIRYRK